MHLTVNRHALINAAPSLKCMNVFPVLVLTANCGPNHRALVKSVNERHCAVSSPTPASSSHFMGEKCSPSSGASWNRTPADWHRYKVDSLHWWAEVVLLNQSGVIPAPGPDDSRLGPNGLLHFYASLWQCLLLATVQTSKKGKHSPQGLHFIRLKFSFDAQVNTTTFKCS